MATQIAHPYEHDPHNAGQQPEGEEQGDKKSVLKKVKAKARKLKDTIKSHTHGHNNDHDQHREGHDYDVEDEDDEGEESVEDPEIQGDPGYESAAIKSSIPGQDIGNPGNFVGRSKPMQEDFTRNPEGELIDPVKISVPEREKPKDELKVDVVRARHIKEVPDPPLNTPASPGVIGHNTPSTDPVRSSFGEQTTNRGQPEVQLEQLVEDPHAPKDRQQDYDPPNYQTKVTDPTVSGGEEAGISSILHSLNKVNVSESKPAEEEILPSVPQGLPHPCPTGSHDQFSPGPNPPKLLYTDEKPEKVPGSSETLKTQDHSGQSSYTQKVSSATAIIADKAISAKNVVASKLGYGEKDPNGEREIYESTPSELSTNEKPEKVPRSSDTLNTQDQPDQSSYTGKISSATAIIADKAISAKNVVASKLGYGEKDTRKEGEIHEEQGSPKPASAPVEYGKKMAATVTGKLTPVYEKVAGAGSTVISKVQGTSTDGTGTVNAAERGGEGQDKGVSVKDYFAEKLKPGEEDKALSEVISEALHTRKEDAEKTGRPMGKVTESEEVKRRLGSIDESAGERVDDDPGKGVVDKVKGAVGSWFSKGEDTKISRQSLGSSTGTQGFPSSEEQGMGERRLQASGN